MRIVLIYILTTIITTSSIAQQLSDSVFIKLEHPSQYNLVPVEDQGILIFTNKDRDVRSKEKTWAFSLYDQSFQSKWSKEITVESKYAFQAYHYGQGKLYMIFNRFKKKSLKIVTVNLTNGEVSRQDLETFARFEVFSFKAINDNLFIDARLVNSPTLIHADLKTNKVRALSTSFKGYPKVSRVDVMPDLNRVNVISVNKSRDRRELIVKVYSDDGKELELYKTKSEGNKKLLNGSISKVTDEKAFIIGTYSEKLEDKEIGICVTQFVLGVQVSSNYLAFSEIDGFVPMSKSGDSLLKEKKVKRYRLNAHPLIKTSTGYMMVGEAYYPIYRREAHTYFDAAGLPVTSYYQVFDGWNYTHGVICSFGQDGQIEWSKTFDFDDVLSMDTREVVNIRKVGERTALVFIQDGKTVLQPLSEEQETKLVAHKKGLQTLNQSNVAHWYNEYYISWSIESDKDDRRKKIIRCNKIDFK